MRSIESELLLDLGTVILEVFVPLAVQRSMPQVRDMWRELVETNQGATAIEDCYSRFLKSRRSVGESVRNGIEAHDKSLILLRDGIYGRIAQNASAIRAFMVRPVTAGNEQCPYWNGFAYTEKP